MTVALAGGCPRSRLLLAGCDPKVSGQLYHAREFLRAAFGERELLAVVLDGSLQGQGVDDSLDRWE